MIYSQIHAHLGSSERTTGHIQPSTIDACHGNRKAFIVAADLIADWYLKYSWSGYTNQFTENGQQFTHKQCLHCEFSICQSNREIE